jgi:hypothetical protein
MYNAKLNKNNLKKISYFPCIYETNRTSLYEDIRIEKLWN